MKMKTNTLVAGLIFILLVPFKLLAADGLPSFSQGYDPKRDPFADGRAAIALASRSDRHVMIQIGGAWCSWCHVLDRLIEKHADIKQTLHQYYVVLKVNVSEDNGNAEFLSGLPQIDGYPHIFVTDGGGDILHSQDVSQFMADGTYDPARIRAFLQRWRPE